MDIEKRLSAHNKGTASKYTRARLPVLLVYFEELDSKGEAMKREIIIKRLSRAKKQQLVDSR